MNSEINDLAKQILSLDLLKAAELVKELESELGLPIGSSVFSGSSAPSAVESSAAPAVEKTEYSVILESFGDKKIDVIKAVRKIADLGLKEAKDLVESSPQLLVSKKSKEEAEKIKQELISAGASVKLE